MAILSGLAPASAKDTAKPVRPPVLHAPTEEPIEVHPVGAKLGRTDTSQSAMEGSGVLKAMGHELKRSMDSLRIKGRPSPYFLSYLLWDVESFHMQASLGSCEMTDEDRQHLVDAELRVGGYDQDNSNF